MNNNNRKDNHHHHDLVGKRTRFIMNNNNNNTNAVSDDDHLTVPSLVLHQQQSSLMSSHQVQQQQQPQGGFPFWGDHETMINNNNNNNNWNHHDHHQLSLDLSAMTLFDEDHHNHHQQPNNNNITRIRGNNNNNNLADSITNMNINMPPFWESHAYNNNNNIVEDETVSAAATHPRFLNMSTPKSTFGVSPSQGLVSDIKWGMQKGHTFGGVSQMGSSIDLGQGHGLCYGHGRGRVVPVQLQNPSFYSSYNPYEQRPTVYPSPRGSSFVMENDLGWDVSTNNPIMYTTPNVNNAAVAPPPPSPPQQLYYPSNRHFQLPQSLYPTRPIEEPVAFKCDSSFILQENDMKNECNNSSLLGGRKYPYSQEGVIPQISHFPCKSENSRNFVTDDDDDNDVDGYDDLQQNLMNFGSSSFPELQSYMLHMARDQNGGRFLQSLVEKGRVEDMEVVFNGVIDNVVELMMDPFGNYLVQKLLEFCRDEQRLQIVLMLTKEPGQLVRTSFNTHGTRVVQKLISTLKSKRQIALVRSAIQPSFLDLVKDLNGNHVIQRCLSSWSVQDNEFIFDAAIKFLLDVATHQHGCCVLQRCIDFSKGKSLEKLVKEICKYGFSLAQDPYGNYVVQYIIQMQIPSAIAKLTPQFKGNYVLLSTQKFSSHVVEKCLEFIVEARARIVQELLSVPQFERLLQDPYGNYVVQRALEFTKGSLHASLVEAVRAHKMLRTSPYCKRIFSKTQFKK
ncbi:hypothetical protein P8452_47861 [Trifolium repens]|nr:hypothetical protein P8452_47861 [Trifolium repens]